MNIQYTDNINLNVYSRVYQLAYEELNKAVE